MKAPMTYNDIITLFKAHISKTKHLKLNYVDIIEDWEKPGDAEDKNMTHFNDTSDWSRGSPLCLYGLSRQFAKRILSNRDNECDKKRRLLIRKRVSSNTEFKQCLINENIPTKDLNAVIFTPFANRVENILTNIIQTDCYIKYLEN